MIFHKNMIGKLYQLITDEWEFISYMERHRDDTIQLVLTGKQGWDHNFQNYYAGLGEFKDSIVLTGYLPDEDLTELYKKALLVI